MWLTDQWQGYQKRKESLEKYTNAVERLLQKTTVTDAEAQALNTIQETYGIPPEKTLAKRIELVRHVYRQSIEDKKLSEAEQSRLESLMHIFMLKKEDVALDQTELIKYSTLNKIAKGTLPDITEIADHIGVTFGKDEVINGIEVGELMKIRKVTERLNYGGFSTSIRIVKGFRYRTGSFNVQRIHKEVLASEDRGVFWISNQRLGFKGANTNFSIEWKKVASLQLGEYGLMLFKQGREKPYILNLKDYDVTCALASYYMNPDDRGSGEDEEELPTSTPDEAVNVVEAEEETVKKVLQPKSLLSRWYIKVLIGIFVIFTLKYTAPILLGYWIYVVWKKTSWHIVWKTMMLFVLVPLFIGFVTVLFQR